jgi:hypothetical protein
MSPLRAALMKVKEKERQQQQEQQQESVAAATLSTSASDDQIPHPPPSRATGLRNVFDEQKDSTSSSSRTPPPPLPPRPRDLSPNKDALLPKTNTGPSSSQNAARLGGALLAKKRGTVLGRQITHESPAQRQARLIEEALDNAESYSPKKPTAPNHFKNVLPVVSRPSPPASDHGEHSSDGSPARRGGGGVGSTQKKYIPLRERGMLLHGEAAPPRFPTFKTDFFNDKDGGSGHSEESETKTLIKLNAEDGEEEDMPDFVNPYSNPKELNPLHEEIMEFIQSFDFKLISEASEKFNAAANNRKSAVDYSLNLCKIIGKNFSFLPYLTLYNINELQLKNMFKSFLIIKKNSSETTNNTTTENASPINKSTLNPLKVKQLFLRFDRREDLLAVEKSPVLYFLKKDYSMEIQLIALGSSGGVPNSPIGSPNKVLSNKKEINTPLSMNGSPRITTAKTLNTTTAGTTVPGSERNTGGTNLNASNFNFDNPLRAKSPQQAIRKAISPLTVVSPVYSDRNPPNYRENEEPLSVYYSITENQVIPSRKALFSDGEDSPRKAARKYLSPEEDEEEDNENEYNNKEEETPRSQARPSLVPFSAPKRVGTEKSPMNSSNNNSNRNTPVSAMSRRYPTTHQTVTTTSGKGGSDDNHTTSDSDLDSNTRRSNHNNHNNGHQRRNSKTRQQKKNMNASIDEETLIEDLALKDELLKSLSACSNVIMTATATNANQGTNNNNNNGRDSVSPVSPPSLTMPVSPPPGGTTSASASSSLTSLHAMKQLQSNKNKIEIVKQIITYVTSPALYLYQPLEKRVLLPFENLLLEYPQLAPIAVSLVERNAFVNNLLFVNKCIDHKTAAGQFQEFILQFVYKHPEVLIASDSEGLLPCDHIKAMSFTIAKNGQSSGVGSVNNNLKSPGSLTPVASPKPGPSTPVPGGGNNVTQSFFSGGGHLKYYLLTNIINFIGGSMQYRYLLLVPHDNSAQQNKNEAEVSSPPGKGAGDDEQATTMTTGNSPTNNTDNYISGHGIFSVYQQDEELLVLATYFDFLVTEEEITSGFFNYSKKDNKFGFSILLKLIIKELYYLKSSEKELSIILFQLLMKSIDSRMSSNYNNNNKSKRSLLSGGANNLSSPRSPATPQGNSSNSTTTTVKKEGGGGGPDYYLDCILLNKEITPLMQGTDWKFKKNVTLKDSQIYSQFQEHIQYLADNKKIEMLLGRTYGHFIQSAFRMIVSVSEKG